MPSEEKWLAAVRKDSDEFWRRVYEGDPDAKPNEFQGLKICRKPLPYWSKP